MTDRDAAWGAVHEALPAGWTVSPPTFDPGVPGWSVTARSVAFSRRKPPQAVTGTGLDETAALRALDDPSPRRPVAQRLTEFLGGGKEKAEYHAVVTWDRLAEIAGRYLGKAQQVAIEGRLQTR